MSLPWGKVERVQESVNLQDIISEEIARNMQLKEDNKYLNAIVQSPSDISPSIDIANDVPKDLIEDIAGANDSDAVIAQMLQYQFDREYDEELKRIENKKNGLSKVSVSYVNHRMIPEELLSDSDDDCEGYDYEKKDWDRFETAEKQFPTIPRCGYKIQEGKIVTKHDMEINGCRNACKVMAFPPEFHTGDTGGFDMNLPNSVFNSLKAHSRQEQSRRNRIHDRKEDRATAEMGVDEITRLLLFKMINNQLLESVNGVISTGKEAVILHAFTDPAYTECLLPKECAIKVYKTTLNEFKQRDKYIKQDYRFKDRYSKQNPRKIVHLWAEKEMRNLMRMQKIGLNVPDVIGLKKHVLVMSFIGNDNCAAPKLKDASLSPVDWIIAYNEAENAMYKLYNEAKLIHADFSEYNILWHDGKSWIIDVSQSVESEHPSGLEFLMRDCENIHTFFTKKGVPGVKTSSELFSYITNLDANTHNTAMLERINVKGPPPHIMNMEEGGLDENKPLVFPFDYAWEKSQEKIREEFENTKQEHEIKPIDIDKDGCVTNLNIPNQHFTTPSENSAVSITNIS